MTIKKQLLSRMMHRLEMFGVPREGAAITIALSGGPDSVALTHLLYALRKKWNLRLYLAHLNHGLRGKESDEDEAFVKNLARLLELPLDSEKIDLKTRHQVEGGNLQDLARACRYSFLQEVARKHSSPWLALGHILDDQAETILLSLIRGAGRRGLCGMPACRMEEGLTLIRPMIDIERKELLEYLNASGIAYRMDSSNESMKYRRNRIRLEIMPRLIEINPRLYQGLSLMSEIFKDEEDFLNKAAREAMEKIACQIPDHLNSPGSQILWCTAWQDLSQLPPALIRRFFSLLFEDAVSPKSEMQGIPVKNIFDAVQSSKPQWDLTLSDRVRLSRRYDYILLVQTEAKLAGNSYILPDQGTLPVKEFGGSLEIQRMDKPDYFQNLFQQEEVLQSRTVYIDADYIQEPLVLRSRKSGDRMTPLGMKGTKKVKELMIEARLTHEQRFQPRILTCGAEILWVIGCAQSESCKIQDQTRNVIRISLIVLAPLSAETEARTNRIT